MWLRQLRHVAEGLLKDILTSLGIPPVKSCSTFCLDEKETGIGTVVSAPSVSWLPFGQLEMLPYFPGPNVSALPFVEIFSDS